MLIEVCANSVQSAINAQLGGAARVELCCDLEHGGLTPSLASIQLARKHLNIELFVLIRPRTGDFCYNGLEYEIIKKDIENAKTWGVDGVVIGLLKTSGKVDVDRVRELVKLARPMSVTFHRAFDFTPDPFDALTELIRLDVDRILTSGQKFSAFEGRKLIAQLNKVAGNYLKIMAGGGINDVNVKDLVNYTRIQEVHFSARTLISSPFYSPLKGIVKHDYNETSARSVFRIKQILDALGNKKIV